MNPDRYLDRIGVGPEQAHPPNFDALARLQWAHVTTIPFETLSITGDPFGERDGEGVSLALADRFEKLVDRRRGGFCYELNGTFGWLLAELGFDVERRSARVFADGEPGPPADHLALVVSLDRRYLVDVGFGAPVARRPIPLDDTTPSAVGRDDPSGVGRDGPSAVGRDDPSAVGPDWRVVGSDRPDADYVAQCRDSGGKWADQYCFRDVPREMPFFEATCEYHQIAPGSPFTGDPIAMIATERGHRTLSTDNLTVTVDGEKEKRPVAEDEWHDVLEREFGIRYRS